MDHHRMRVLGALAVIVVLTVLLIAVIVVQLPGDHAPTAMSGAFQASPVDTSSAPATFTLPPTGTPIAISGTVPAALPDTAVVAPTSTPTPTPLPATFPVVQDPVPILMYHYIRPDPGPTDPVGQGLSVSPELFAAQIAYLSEGGYTTITMAELADAWNGRRALPAKPVVLTFDDGYRDFYTDAWPILRQYGFSATVYLIADVIDQPAYLTADMILELDSSGQVDFGSHTVTHPELPALDDTEAEREIAGSKQMLEDRLNHPVRTFCYPVGRYSERDVALVSAAGYELAVTTEWGSAIPSMDHHLLSRIRISGWTTVEELQSWLS